MSPGLLQFSVQRYHGQSLLAFAVSSECGCAAHNWHQPMRPHHTSFERTPLVTSSTVRRVQISRVRLHGLTAPITVNWRLLKTHLFKGDPGA